MVRIPEETINSIRENTNILDVVSQFVQLKKSGNNHFAHCPFHEDNTPSFSVNEKKQIYKCFSCGRGGNVFGFIQEVEGINFPEAVVKVAELSEYDLNEQLIQQISNDQVASEDSRRGKLLKITEKASYFYHHILMNTKVGEEAYQYLIDRGMEEDTIKEFGIGFSPSRRDALHLFLENQNDLEINDDLLGHTGLFSDRQGNSQFLDRLAGRIIFPIRDSQGHPVAFSGRILPTEKNADFKTAKYINSPETELFNKRRILFNYDKARSFIRRNGEAILFEGFMDVISSWQAGIKNGIASMGTSLTQEQIGLINRVTDNVTIAFDGDKAGLEATKRTIEYFEEKTHFSIEIANFPENLDPDEFIQKKGKQAYIDFINHGRDTVMSFFMHYLKKEMNLNNESERISYIDEVLKQMTNVSNPVEREIYLKQLAEQFDLSIEPLQEQLQENILSERTRQADQLRKDRKENQYASYEPPKRQYENKVKLSKVERAEQMLLQRLFYHREIWVQIQNLDYEFEFAHESYQTLFLLYESYFITRDEQNVEGFLDILNDNELKKKATEIIWLDLGEEMYPGEIEDYINQISNISPVENTLKIKEQELKEAKRVGDAKKQLSLVMEITNLQRKIKR